MPTLYSPGRKIIPHATHYYAANYCALYSNTEHSNAFVHVHLLTIIIHLSHRMKLKERMNSTNHHHLPDRVIYHHLLISARSPLISRDSSLLLTMDNTIHILTPNITDAPWWHSTAFTYLSTPIRGYHISFTRMKVGLINGVRYPRNAL